METRVLDSTDEFSGGLRTSTVFGDYGPVQTEVNEKKKKWRR